MLYPVLNEARALLDLGGVWRFETAGCDSYDPARCGVPLDHAMTMAVPASYNDQKDDCNLRAHYGFVLYQTTFTLPRALQNERIVLRFGAVTHAAEVYLNGVLLGAHKGGFLPFEFEVQNVIQSGENLLTVAVDNRVNYSTLPVGNETFRYFGSVDNPGIASIEEAKARMAPQNLPNFDFFNYAGIIRPVKLYTTPYSYIEDVTLIPHVENSTGVVDYQIKTVDGNPNDLSFGPEKEVQVTVLDEDGTAVAESKGASGTLTIPNVRLWNPGDAYLYRARVTFGDDVYEEPFGVRTVEVRGTEFLINGRPFYFKGFGKHEDSFCHGRGMDECLNVKDLSLMRWIGANSFRTSHYPYAEEMYRLCDREGIVVIDETPAVGISAAGGVDPYHAMNIRAHHEEVLRGMIARDKNHPCVVMWSLANEPDTESFPDSAYDYFWPLYELAHALDPQNRPVTVVGCQNDYRRDRVLPAMDVCCINRYYGWYNLCGNLDAACDALNIELDYWQTVGKPVMFTEYGADTYPGLHQTHGEMFSEEFQLDYYARIDAEIDKRPFFIGEQLWNFADFATIQGIMRVDGNKKGIFTRDRRPKLAAHFLRRRWHDIPDFDYKQADEGKETK